MTTSTQSRTGDESAEGPPIPSWNIGVRLVAALALGVVPPVYRNWEDSKSYLIAVVLVIGAAASIVLARRHLVPRRVQIVAAATLVIAGGLAALSGVGFSFAVSVVGTQLGIGSLGYWFPTSRSNRPKISLLGLIPFLLAMWGWLTAPEAVPFLVMITLTLIGLEIHRRWPRQLADVIPRLKASSPAGGSVEHAGWTPVDKSSGSDHRRPSSDPR